MQEKLNKHLWWLGGALILLLFILYEITQKLNIPILYALTVISAGYFLYLCFVKKITYKIAILFIMVWGLLVRLFVMYRMAPLGDLLGNMQHDLFWQGFRVPKNFKPALSDQRVQLGRNRRGLRGSLIFAHSASNRVKIHMHPPLWLALPVPAHPAPDILFQLLVLRRVGA